MPMAVSYRRHGSINDEIEILVIAYVYRSYNSNISYEIFKRITYGHIAVDWLCVR